MGREKSLPAPISEQELRIVSFLRESTEWVTSAQVTSGAKVSSSTARHRLLRLVKIGACEVTAVFAEHRYRWKPTKEAAAYVKRIADAETIVKASS